jgi:hypothetical protein
MINILYRLRDVVWSAVLAFAFAVLTPIVAIFSPENIALVVGLGLSSASLAILSHRV